MSAPESASGLQRFVTTLLEIHNSAPAESGLPRVGFATSTEWYRWLQDAARQSDTQVTDLLHEGIDLTLGQLVAGDCGLSVFCKDADAEMRLRNMPPIRGYMGPTDYACELNLTPSRFAGLRYIRERYGLDDLTIWNDAIQRLGALASFVQPQVIYQDDNCSHIYSDLPDFSRVEPLPPQA